MAPAARRHIDLRSVGKLFGTDQAPTGATPNVHSNNIRLVGVIVADDPKSSIALFEIDGNPLTLLTGAQLPDGEVLKNVAPLDVTLEQDGKERMLEWTMRQAPTNAVFETLAMTSDLATGQPAGPMKFPRAKPSPSVPLRDQMTSLRQAALQVLAKRNTSTQPRPNLTPPR